MAIIKGEPRIPPTEATSPDGRVSVLATTEGVRVTVTPKNLASVGSLVKTVRILRNGVPIRGADPVSAPGGGAQVLDLYVPYGQSSTWQAEFCREDGSRITSSNSATLTLPQLWGHEGGDIWLKADSAGSWNALRSHVTPDGAAERTGSSVHTLQYAYGSSVPGGNFEVARRDEETWTIWTQDLAQLNELRNVLARGFVYRQVSSWYDFPDQWMMYIDHQEATLPGEDIHTSRERYVTVKLQPIATPPTVNSSPVGITRSSLPVNFGSLAPGTDVFIS